MFKEKCIRLKCSSGSTGASDINTKVLLNEPVTFSFDVLKTLGLKQLRKSDELWKYGMLEDEVVFERLDVNNKKKILFLKI